MNPGEATVAITTLHCVISAFRFVQLSSSGPGPSPISISKVKTQKRTRADIMIQMHSLLLKTSKSSNGFLSTNQLAHTGLAHHAGGLLGRRSRFCCFLLFKLPPTKNFLRSIKRSKVHLQSQSPKSKLKQDLTGGGRKR